MRAEQCWGGDGDREFCCSNFGGVDVEDFFPGVGASEEFEGVMLNFFQDGSYCVVVFGPEEQVVVELSCPGCGMCGDAVVYNGVGDAPVFFFPDFSEGRGHGQD